MPRTPSNSGSGLDSRPICSWVAMAWLVVLMMSSAPALAQRVEGERARAHGIYAAEVEVNGQGKAERLAGFERALGRVLGKLSGDDNAASRPGVGQELERAQEYVEGYDYRQDEGVAASGAPSYDTVLVVRFNQAKVDGLASAMGIPVWPSPRPKPVLWLAIDDGSGPRLVGLAQAAAARSALNQAVERGYKLGLPSGTAAEQALVGAIWRGDTAAVARASQRYSPPMQLIGKLYRSDGGWASDWIFVDHGEVLSRWSQSGPSARQLMAVGADGAADALMDRYARSSPTGPAGSYRVAITGIDDTADYLRLSSYLQQLPVVRAITPVRASAQGLQLDLQLLSGLAGFEHMIATSDVLVAGASAYPADLPPSSDVPVPPAPVQAQATYRLR